MNKPEDVTMTFGKYKGEQLGQILADDPAYLGWLNEEADIRTAYLREAVEEMCNKYAVEIEAAAERKSDR